MEENKDQPNNESSAPQIPKTVADIEKKKKRSKLISILIVLAVLIMIPILVYLVKQQEISTLKEGHIAEMESLKNSSSSFVADLNRTGLETSAHIMSWAVGAEIGKNKLEIIGKYMTELAKKPHYRRVLLLANDGKIILSTDKKYEGEGFFTIFKKELVGGEPFSAIPQKSGELMVFAPVEVLGQRVATLVIFYFPSSIDFAESAENAPGE